MNINEIFHLTDTSIATSSLFEEDLRLDDATYQDELEKHMNELDLNVDSEDEQNLNIEGGSAVQADPSTKEEIKEEIKEENKEPINEPPDEPNKEDTKDDKTTHIDKLSKKTDDFKHKMFTYKPEPNQMNFINSLPTDTYTMVEYLSGKNKEDNKKLSNFTQDLNMKVMINDTNQITCATTEYYKTDKINDDNWIYPIDEKKNVDFIGELNNVLNSSHSFLNYQTTKAELIAKYPHMINPINYFIQHSDYRSPSTFTDWLATCSYAFADFYKFQKIVTYIKTTNKLLSIKEVKLNNNKLKNEFKVQKLPKELLEILRHLTYYFKEIKDKLELNEKSGFYYLTYEGIQYPIMCKHVYMTMIGKSLYQISSECCVNSQCKYCGDSMISYQDDDVENIPSSVAELTYNLIQCTNAADDDSIFRIIYNMFTGVISKFVKQDDPKFEDKATAIVGLYVYKILNYLINKQILSSDDKLVVKIINNITWNASQVGWDQIKIEQLLKNENLFGNLDLFANILVKKDDISSIEDILKETFKEASSEDIKKLKEEDKLFKFNSFLDMLIIDKVNFMFIQKIIDEMKNGSKIDSETPKETMYSSSVNTIDLFKKVIHNYCPKNFLHVWEGNKCSKCGIEKDLKNIDKIYEKYNSEFNNKFDLKPINKIGKIEEKNKENSNNEIIKKALNEVNSDEIIKDYLRKSLNIGPNEVIRILNNTYLYENYLINEIINVLGEDLLKSLKNVKEIIKVYIYLDKIGTNKEMMNIFRIPLLSPETFIKKKEKTFEDAEEDDDL